MVIHCPCNCASHAQMVVAAHFDGICQLVVSRVCEAFWRWSWAGTTAVVSNLCTMCSSGGIICSHNSLNGSDFQTPQMVVFAHNKSQSSSQELETARRRCKDNTASAMGAQQKSLVPSFVHIAQ